MMESLENEILRARNFHEKEYIVTVNRPVTDEFLRGMAGGVPSSIRSRESVR